MLRFTILPAILCGVLALHASGASPWRTSGPPNSFEPSAAGEVLFSHERSRAVACALIREKKRALVCRADRKSIDAATTVVLHPIVAPSIGPRDKRRKIEVAVSGPAGRQQRPLVLGIGEWAIEWDGYPGRPRFRVAAADSFEIRLKTIEGACTRSGADCTLDAAVRTRDCSIPESHRDP